MSLYLIPGPEKIQWHRTWQSTHCAVYQMYVSRFTSVSNVRIQAHQCIKCTFPGSQVYQMYVSRFTGDKDVVLRMPPGRRVSDLKWVSWSSYVELLTIYWHFKNSSVQKHFGLSSQVALSLVSRICRRLWAHRHRCLTIRPAQCLH